MANIFVGNQTIVAELSKNGQVFVNTTKRAIEGNVTRKDFAWEIKVSTLSEELIPVICNIEVTRSLEGAEEIIPKQKCDAMEAIIRKDLEDAGYTVIQGVVSEGNTQRFTMPLAQIIEKDKEVKRKTSPRKKKE